MRRGVEKKYGRKAKVKMSGPAVLEERFTLEALCLREQKKRAEDREATVDAWSLVGCGIGVSPHC
jgi:hypothetical protein